MKITCQVCGVTGYLQHIGKNYFRVRHYLGYRNGKPHFQYHKQDPSYIQSLVNQKDEFDHIDQRGQGVDRSQRVLENLNLSSDRRMAVDGASGYSLVWLGHQPATVLLQQFQQFCMIDLRRAEGTTKNNVYELNRFLKWLGKDPRQATTEDIRSYLARFLQHAPGTYSNVLKALKVFYRDYLQRPNLVKSFKFPQRQFTLKTVPKKTDLQKFYTALDSDRARCLFLLLASSGRRIGEILDLSIKDIDFEQRMLRPSNGYSNRTKRTWFSFYNAETEKALRVYLGNSSLAGKLFPVVKRIAQRWFYQAQRESGVRVRPKDLRDWFCCEMGERGVPDRYIDAFCGRVPKSVLARHYTDYSPERLKRIYEKADLRILH